MPDKTSIRCKKCDSTLTYIVKSEKLRYCRQCGHEEPLNEEEKESG